MGNSLSDTLNLDGIMKHRTPQHRPRRNRSAWHSQHWAWRGIRPRCFEPK